MYRVFRDRNSLHNLITLIFHLSTLITHYSLLITHYSLLNKNADHSARW
ncbi:MAG: hypothetical protein F6K47_04905 [Symploca sp. SIO2E6]|nr:hypothetical protein [Symploca sp. SIO2E6]